MSKVSDQGGWLEPESSFNDEKQPVYPFNHSLVTDSGHSWELDDTPGRERIRLQHRTGTFIEMHPDGNEVHKVYGDGYEITIKDKNVLVKGDCHVTIDGDSVVHIKGNKIEKIEGNYEQLILGNYTQSVAKQSRIFSTGEMTIGSDNKMGGHMNIVTGGTIHVSGDVNIDGELTADKILSETRVDALLGVSAGPLGFVTQLGGISVGFPSPGAAVAIPGTINSIGPIFTPTTITAGISMNSPLGLFGLMKAGLMTDSVNKRIYNRHWHRKTGSTLLKMV